MRNYHQIKLQKKALYDHKPWKIIEKKFEVDNNHHNETIFSLGNGYIGIRGTLEEDYSGPEDTTTPGMYINGIYGSDDIIYGEEAPHQPKKSQTILNLADWTGINLYLGEDREKFDMLTGRVEDYHRTLNIKEGTLTRKLRWKSPRGREVMLEIVRFVSLSSKHTAVINYNVTPLNFEGKIQLVSSLEGNICNSHFMANPDILEVTELDISNNMNFIRQSIESSGIDVGLATADCPEPEATNSFALIEEDKIIRQYEFIPECEETVTFTKYLSVFTSREVKKKNLSYHTHKGLEKSEAYGYEKLLADHKERLWDFWQDIDIRIVGDMAQQQAYRFNILHLLQSTGRDGHTSAPAKGLTGEYYEGHYFWDTEAYIFPFFLYTRPEYARQLLIYRYNILDKARENARRVKVGGALYPWRTINGQEASAFFMGSTVQYHINADMAYAVKQYFSATADFDFMYRYGIEMLVETARMWASRATFNEDEEKYFFNEVCGPDEYKPGVNNNCYTNYMAKFNLEYSVEAVKMAEHRAPEHFHRLKEKLNLKPEEIDVWLNMAEKIYLPYDERRQIHPQDDSFLDKDKIDVDSIPLEEFPLTKNWHPLTIWRYQVIKQADVILLMLLLGDQFDSDTKKNNYDFYEPRTTHDSSLSPAAYSIIASEIGYHEDAFRYFIQTARLDLDDFNENTYQGVHLACMGSTWMVIVQGFAGMRVYKNRLSFNPYLPEDWDGYEFKIMFRDCRIKVRVDRELVLYVLLEGEQITFLHGDESVSLNRDNRRQIIHQDNKPRKN
ncbi:MAG: glycoside hydrolase family 65 protein [Halanaerobiaceae bacterium]